MLLRSLYASVPIHAYRREKKTRNGDHERLWPSSAPSPRGTAWQRRARLPHLGVGRHVIRMPAPSQAEAVIRSLARSTDLVLKRFSCSALPENTGLAPSWSPSRDASHNGLHGQRIQTTVPRCQRECREFTPKAPRSEISPVRRSFSEGGSPAVFDKSASWRSRRPGIARRRPSLTTPPRPNRYASPALSLSKGQSLPPATSNDMPGLPYGTGKVTGKSRTTAR